VSSGAIVFRSLGLAAAMVGLAPRGILALVEVVLAANFRGFERREPAGAVV